MTYRVENSWSPEPAPGGMLTISLFNLSEAPLAGFTLSYTAITRVMPDAPAPENAVFLKRDANYHRFAPPEGLSVPPGGSWTFRAAGLNRAPLHRGDGVKSAYVTLASGDHIDAEVGDLMRGSDRPEEPPARLPEGRLEHPFALVPWPARLDLVAGDTPLALVPAEDSSAEDTAALAAAGALQRRLFPAARAAVSLAPQPGTRRIAFARDPALAPGAYRLNFAAAICLESADAEGRRHGLVALVQLLHGATARPETFRFPATGVIEDAPRYAWRGCHLDVCRHFWPAQDVRRFLDILGWYRLNIFHWHLTDDEGWRFEVPGLPSLTTIGATRGADGPLLPQLGDPAASRTQFYTTEELRALVAHAASLGIEVVPEIDIPGHSTAMLAALPHLVDPDEPPSYSSVQGYVNNALNPAIEATYEALGLVFDAMVAVFPSRHIHIGGDEVARDSWMASPLARALMEREGLRGTFELQSYFLRRVKDMLTARDRVLVGWNEVAHGGGVPAKDTLLMAWENPQVGAALAREGYDVVITPGQAYYLDMAQSPAWREPGAGWAGSSTPEQTYAYDAEASFPAELRPRFRGVQACIWCEHFHSKDYFNDLVFPRLAAIAEAAWTPLARKDWLRFAVQARNTPRL